MFNEITWRHAKTGKQYTIISFAIEEQDLTPQVVYVGQDGGVWVRPCVEFFDGRFVMDGTAAPTEAREKSRMDRQRETIAGITEHVEEEA